MDPKLKPCPFCGSKAEFIENELIEVWDKSWDVSCTREGCWVNMGGDWQCVGKQVAADLWNDRPLERERAEHEQDLAWEMEECS